MTKSYLFQGPTSSILTTDSVASAISEDTRTGVSTLSSSSNDQSSNLVQTVGNRISLGEDSWSGWSSVFDSELTEFSVTPKVELSATLRGDLSDAVSPPAESTEGEHLPEQPSFNTLLQTYGAPTPLHGSGSHQTEIDVSHVPRTNEVSLFFL